jgi:hypothetical protein
MQEQKYGLCYVFAPINPADVPPPSPRSRRSSLERRRIPIASLSSPLSQRALKAKREHQRGDLSACGTAQAGSRDRISDALAVRRANCVGATDAAQSTGAGGNLLPPSPKAMAGQAASAVPAIGMRGE